MADAPKSPIPNLPPIDPEALQKSLAEIEQVLHERTLHFGMDLSKLGLDKEEL